MIYKNAKHLVSKKYIMKIFKIVFWVLWRIWFYILMFIPIVIMLPFLIVSIISEKTYRHFFWMARIWARFILFGMGFYYKIEKEQKFEKGKSYMFVANHTSMTDIMLMLAVVKDNPFVFVGKAELSKIPLFGFFYKRTCILVDRSNRKSRFKVFEDAQKKIDQGLSVCIFPEGGVPENESTLLDEFKDGAFRLAIEHQMMIVPMTFVDNKKRFSFTFLSGNTGRMRVNVHSFIDTKGLKLEDKACVKKQVRAIILKNLESYEK
jgi:1-acyl-sn-glycerol-3-phosphate acyltransferase